MANFCEFTGARPKSGKKVSHSNQRTPRRFLPNLKKKRYEIPELGRSVLLTLSTRAIRSIDTKGGISRAILKAKKESLSDRLQRIRRQIEKKTRPQRAS